MVAIAALVLLRFAGAPILMGFVLVGVDSPGTMAAMIIGPVIILAVALQERWNGRPF